jgi:hypothetical protein
MSDDDRSRREFHRKQLIGVLGGLPAIVLVVLVCQNAPDVFAGVALPADELAPRLAFALRWLLIPGLALLAGVQLAGRRGFMPGAIDGSRTPPSHSFEINLRYNQNTLEQAVLAALAWTNLAIVLPHAQLVLIPAMACLFGFGRITFWIGYLLYPMARAFGMVLTALPTLGAYLWLVWRAITG